MRAHRVGGESKFGRDRLRPPPLEDDEPHEFAVRRRRGAEQPFATRLVQFVESRAVLAPRDDGAWSHSRRRGVGLRRRVVGSPPELLEVTRVVLPPAQALADPVGDGGRQSAIEVLVVGEPAVRLASCGELLRERVLDDALRLRVHELPPRAELARGVLEHGVHQRAERMALSRRIARPEVLEDAWLIVVVHRLVTGRPTGQGGALGEG
jgi:hypothetical protein